jgi:type IV pilus assembly protein PilA
MMLVVIIAGILVTLAVFGVRKYIFAAKTTEAIHMIGAIKAAQEAYKDETFTYLDVTGSLSSYYPAASPGRFKTQWGGGGNGAAKWKELNVQANSAVQFGYACVAGDATESPPQPGELKENINWPSPAGEPWYIVKALGDQDGNGVKSVYVSSSFRSQIYFEEKGSSARFVMTYSERCIPASGATQNGVRDPSARRWPQLG